MINYRHFTYFLLFVLVFQFFSCARNITKSDTKKETVIYPLPPDTARIQFLTAISGSSDIMGKQSAFSKFVLGESNPKPIIKPYGIAVSGGKMFICDPGMAGLEIIDLVKNTFDYFTPGGKGILQVPLNCFVDEDGNLYVADGGRMQIVVFDKNRNYLTSFGEGKKFKPTDVFVYANKIWIPDMNNNKINVYDKASYELLYSFPKTDKSSEGYLFMPTNLYIANDMVYVSDIGGFDIKIYSLDGKYLSTVGSHGDKIGEFARPKGIAVDDNSNLYVVDAGFENVQIFNKEGKILMFFGGPYKSPGDMWLPAKVTISYDKLKFFQKFVDPAYNLKYLIFVTNQYGPDRLNVYGAIEPRIKKIP
jgi:DNA-binding beta-propeller fold protein YncE